MTDFECARRGMFTSTGFLLMHEHEFGQAEVQRQVRHAWLIVNACIEACSHLCIFVYA